MTENKQQTAQVTPPTNPATRGAKASEDGGGKHVRPWIAVVVVLALAGVAFWLWFERVPERKEVATHVAEEVKQQVTQKVEELLIEEMPTDSAVTSEDAHVSTEVTTEPAQAESVDAGTTIGDTSSVDNTSVGDTTSGGETPESPGQTARGLLSGTSVPDTMPEDVADRKDDTVVRWAFLYDLAQWMVAGYTPGHNGGPGRITVGVQSANTRYGVGMRGLSWIGGDVPSARSEALRYVYTSGMLDALYRMYIDRFMQAMAIESEEALKDDKPMDAYQVAEMYRLYAARQQALAGVLRGMVDIANLHERMTEIRNANKRMMAANEWYEERSFAYTQAREADDAEAIEKARKNLNTASQAYRRTIQERDQLSDALVADICRNPAARGMNTDSMLYVAAWVDRRLQQSPNALDATRKAADLLQDLSGRFAQASQQAH